MRLEREAKIARPYQVTDAVRSAWIRTQLRGIFAVMADSGGLTPEATLPIDGRPVILDDIRSGYTDTRWPLTNTQGYQFIKDVQVMSQWFSRVEAVFDAQKLPIAGVFHPRVLTLMSQQQRREVQRPMPAAKAIEIFDDLGSRLFIPRQHWQARNLLWKHVGKPLDTWLTTTVLERSWSKRKAKYGFTEATSRFWETQTRMPQIGSAEGSSSIHTEGPLLKSITDYDRLGEAMAQLAGVSLDYWQRVRASKLQLIDEVTKSGKYAKTDRAIEKEVEERAHLTGIYPEAYVNSGLEVESIRDGDVVNDFNKKHRLASLPQRVLRRERHRPIEAGQEKFMFIGPRGDVLVVPGALWSEPRQVVILVSTWLKENVVRRDEAAEVKQCGYTVWECVEMAGAGYGKTVDERFAAVKLVGKGGELAWGEVFKNVVGVVSAHDHQEVHKTWSLFVPDVYQFAMMEGSHNTVAVKSLESYKGHGYMDGMPHQRELAAILGEFVRRMEGSQSTGPVSRVGEATGIVQARLELDRGAAATVEHTLKRDPYWEGLRMFARVHTEVDGRELVPACKEFQNTTAEDRWRRAEQFAHYWVRTNISRKDIRQWSRVCGEPPEWVERRLIEFISKREQGLDDLTRITPAYAMALGKLLVMSRYDLPIEQFIVEAYQMPEFINNRMGAALTVLDQEMAAAWNQAYIRFQEIRRLISQPDFSSESDSYLHLRKQLDEAIWFFQEVNAERAINIRGGVARVAAGNGLISSIVSSVEPEQQAVLKQLTAILPGLFGAIPAARILIGKGITSVLVPPKSAVEPDRELVSIFDGQLPLREALYGQQLAVTKFQTVTEAHPGHGFSQGVVQKAAAASGLEGQIFRDFSVELSLHEPLLMKWLLDPKRRGWLNQLMRRCLNRADWELPKEESTVANVIRHHYRRNRTVRERLQPVFQALAKQIEREYQETMAALIFFLKYKPQPPAARSYPTYEAHNPELDTAATRVQKGRVASEELLEHSDQGYWQHEDSPELLRVMNLMKGF